MPPEINALVADARRRLRAAGIHHDEAALDARLLAEHVLGWSQARLLTHGDEPASSQFQTEYESLVRRRTGREPLAYVTGVREFWNLDIEVTPAVCRGGVVGEFQEAVSFVPREARGVAELAAAEE